MLSVRDSGLQVGLSWRSKSFFITHTLLRLHFLNAQCTQVLHPGACQRTHNIFIINKIQCMHEWAYLSLSVCVPILCFSLEYMYCVCVCVCVGGGGLLVLIYLWGPFWAEILRSGDIFRFFGLVWGIRLFKAFMFLKVRVRIRFRVRVSQSQLYCQFCHTGHRQDWIAVSLWSPV